MALPETEFGVKNRAPITERPKPGGVENNNMAIKKYLIDVERLDSKISIIGAKNIILFHNKYLTH